MSSHPIENKKVLLVDEEERVRKGISERKERVGRQREREGERGGEREKLFMETNIKLTFLFHSQEIYSTGNISTGGQNY